MAEREGRADGWKCPWGNLEARDRFAAVGRAERCPPRCCRDDDHGVRARLERDERRGRRLVADRAVRVSLHDRQQSLSTKLWKWPPDRVGQTERHHAGGNAE